MNVKRYESVSNYSGNVFLLTKNDESILIDAGCLTKRLHDDIKNTNLKAVLLTHGHFDHIQELDKIISLCGNVNVFCNEEKDFLSNMIKNGSLYFREKVSIKSSFTSLEEKEYQISSFKFKVYFAPGHTEGGLIFYFYEDKAIFFGDTIIETSIGRDDLYSSSTSKLRATLNKIKDLPFKNDDYCYFGHGEKMIYSSLIKYNPYL